MSKTNLLSKAMREKFGLRADFILLSVIMGILIASTAYAPLVFAMPTIEVSNAGTSAYNGLYESETGTYPWMKTTGTYRISFNGGDCKLEPISQASLGYYADLSTDCDSISGLVASSGDWLQDSGSPPSPDFTDATPPPPPFEWGGATSSSDQAQQNLSTALIVFLISMFGMIWLMRKH